MIENSAGSICEVRLPPGGVSIPVRHRTVQELWYILSGGGEVWREAPDGTSRIVPVNPGTALTIPLGCRFKFRTVGAAELRFLCVTIPPWPGEQEAIVEPSAGPWQPTEVAA